MQQSLETAPLDQPIKKHQHFTCITYNVHSFFFKVQDEPSIKQLQVFEQLLKAFLPSFKYFTVYKTESLNQEGAGSSHEFYFNVKLDKSKKGCHRQYFAQNNYKGVQALATTNITYCKPTKLSFKREMQLLQSNPLACVVYGSDKFYMKHLAFVQSMMSRASLRTISNPVASKFYNNGAEQALIATLSPVGLVEKMKTDLGKGLIGSVKDFADQFPEQSIAFKRIRKNKKRLEAAFKMWKIAKECGLYDTQPLTGGSMLDNETFDDLCNEEVSSGRQEVCRLC